MMRLSEAIAGSVESPVHIPAALPPVVSGVLACCNPPCMSDRLDLPMAGRRGNDMKNNNR